MRRRNGFKATPTGPSPSPSPDQERSGAGARPAGRHTRRATLAFLAIIATLTLGLGSLLPGAGPLLMPSGRAPTASTVGAPGVTATATDCAADETACAPLSELVTPRAREPEAAWPAEPAATVPAPQPSAAPFWRPPLAAPADFPALTARAAFVADLHTRTELMAVNADQPVPPASTTKMITALVTVRYADLDEEVRIQPDEPVDITIYSHMGVEAGDVVTVRDLLAGLLIPSGGDAALALARVVGERLAVPGIDPRAAFVAEMNRYATSLGMQHTHFVNPGGEDADGQVTTARDLAIAAAALLEEPVLEKMVATPVMTVSVGGPNARTLTLVNTNQMLGEPGVDGVKTGTTGQAGQNLVLAIRRKDDRLLSVVLGSTDRYADTRAILGFLDRHYRWVRLGRGGDFPDLASELRAQNLMMMTSRTVLMTADEAADLRYTISLAPNPRGGPFAVQGDVVFYTAARELARFPLYTSGPDGASPALNRSRTGAAGP